MEGRAAGDRFEVSVRPEEAYGLRRDGLDAARFEEAPPRAEAARAGHAGLAGHAARLSHRDRAQSRLEKVVDIDLNHPLAGVTLPGQIFVLLRVASERSMARDGCSS